MSADSGVRAPPGDTLGALPGDTLNLTAGLEVDLGVANVVRQPSVRKQFMAAVSVLWSLTASTRPFVSRANASASHAAAGTGPQCSSRSILGIDEEQSAWETGRVGQNPWQIYDTTIRLPIRRPVPTNAQTDLGFSAQDQIVAASGHQVSPSHYPK